MEQKLVRVMTALLCEPWLIVPEMHKTLTDIVLGHASGGEAEELQHMVAASMKANAQKKDYQIVENTAVIPVEGVIGRKFSNSLYSSGVTSSNVFERLVKTAADDDEIRSLLISVDSPGGLALGTPEAADAVAYASMKKPVIAYADGMMASAAYWIASQADVVYSMGSGTIGSIGTYAAFLDRSRQAELLGIKVQVFKSGPYKGMGYPGTSLTEAQQALLQKSVDDITVKFKNAVRRGRGREIAEEIMQGQSFSAEDALQAGLIDGITDAETALRDAVRLEKLRAGRTRE